MDLPSLEICHNAFAPSWAKSWNKPCITCMYVCMYVCMYIMYIVLFGIRGGYAPGMMVGMIIVAVFWWWSATCVSLVASVWYMVLWSPMLLPCGLLTTWHLGICEQAKRWFMITPNPGTFQDTLKEILDSLADHSQLFNVASAFQFCVQYWKSVSGLGTRLEMHGTYICTMYIFILYYCSQTYIWEQ